MLSLGGTMWPVVARAQQPAEVFTPANPEPATQWMLRWMATERGGSGPLHVGRFLDPMYFLLHPIGWTPDPGQPQYATVTVPTGFVTDFASIPQLFWTVLRPDGSYAFAAVIHDYLYWTQTIPREQADDIFRSSMRELRVSTGVIAALYATVRLFGGYAWDANASLRSQGEKRTLKRWPSDAKTSWESWKANSSNFE